MSLLAQPASPVRSRPVHHDAMIDFAYRPPAVRLTISLIIPAYNEESYLPACLTAVMANIGDRAAQIIVVDNNSTDRTKQVIDRFPRVTYVFEAEKGITRARQRGYIAASGDILAFIDADTLPPAGWFDQISDQFAQRPDLACLSGPYSFYDLSGIRNRISRAWFVVARPVYGLTGYMMVGGNFAIRRSVLQQMGGFDASIEFYGEDADIGRRASKFGKVLFLPRFVMPTSGRRMKRQGFVRTASIYLINYISIMLRGKPATMDYQDVR